MDVIKVSKTGTVASIYLKLLQAVQLEVQCIQSVVTAKKKDRNLKRRVKSLSSGEISKANGKIKLKDELHL